MCTNTTIHGTGNAWPQICDDAMCPICSGSDRPLDGRGNTGISLSGANCHILIDFGQGTHAGIRRANLPPVDLVLCTHGHPDHANKMELDTIAKRNRDAGRDEVPIITTQETWEMLPEYQRNQFRHVALAPGKSVSIRIGSTTVRVTALDASSHFIGGVIFVIEMDGFRFGALFDLRNWASVDKTLLERLDLAIIEGNSLYPMSAVTGHVSISEDIAFIDSLALPPRLSLLTHYGHDDEAKHSQGSLVSLLHGLAPQLALGMAHKGMVVPSTSLPPRVPVAILDKETNLIVGVGEKREIHEKSMLHASVLILVCDSDGSIIVYERDGRQSYPGCFDVYGGHMEPADGNDPLVTAMREGAEEVLLFGQDGLRLMLEESWMCQVGPDFFLESTAENNRERSTVFCLRLPESITIKALDQTDLGEDVELVTHRFTLPELEALFVATPNRLADGLRRVLQKMKDDANFRAQVLEATARVKT